MRLAQLGLPTGQHGLRYSSTAAHETAPWLSVWTLYGGGAMRFIPDLSLHLVFDLSGRYEVEPFLWYTGAAWCEMEVPSGSELVGLQLPVWDARSMQQQTAYDDTDDTAYVKTVRVTSEWVFQLYAALLDARDNAAQHGGELAIDGVIELFASYAAGELGTDFSGYFVSVATTADGDRHITHSGYSQRHERRLYTRYVGITRKRFERVARLHRALERLRATGRFDPQEFYDQAHMINEFRALCGYTPRQVLQMFAA